MSDGGQEYAYQVVSGCAVWGPARKTERDALIELCRVRESWPDEPLEVERVLKLPMHGTRYWRWRDGEWSLDRHMDPRRDELARWSEARDDR